VLPLVADPVDTEWVCARGGGSIAHDACGRLQLMQQKLQLSAI